ncbi:MAG: biopolymer transporter ExbD [Chitinophagales bacterium]|nr:biopolymer transporter ExbD [Chitinophagales bacterium]
MAAIPETTPSSTRRPGFSHQKKTHLRIDMTPMVDLGFLLITFFIFTTRLGEPQALKLFLPNDQDKTITPNTTGEGLTLTILLDGKNVIHYYHGMPETALANGEVFSSNYHPQKGIGQVIRDKQKAIDESGKYPEGRKGMVVIIKAGPHASYKNMVDMLDEMLINGVSKYAVVKPSGEELSFLSN